MGRISFSTLLAFLALIVYWLVVECFAGNLEIAVSPNYSRSPSNVSVSAHFPAGSENHTIGFALTSNRGESRVSWDRVEAEDNSAYYEFKRLKAGLYTAWVYLIKGDKKLVKKRSFRVIEGPGE